MAKKKKVRVDRIIILTLVIILVLVAFGFGLYKLFGYLFADNKQDQHHNQDLPPVVVTTDDVEVNLLSYTNYFDDTKDLGFNFVIAEFDFIADEPVKFELKNLQTSEKLTLDDVQSYLNKLELAGYDISALNICTNGVSSENNEVKAKIFIPYKTDNTSLSIYNSKNAKRIEFDLTENIVAATKLKLNKGEEDDGQIIEVDGANITVSDAYLSSTLYHNDEECIIGSTQKIFTFRINANKVGEGVRIVKAQFLRVNESDAIDCLSEDYDTEKDNNAFNTELVDGDNGALFFEIRTSEVRPDFDGVLLITFSNSDKIFEIPTIYE